MGRRSRHHCPKTQWATLRKRVKPAPQTHRQTIQEEKPKHQQGPAQEAALLQSVGGGPCWKRLLCLDSLGTSGHTVFGTATGPPSPRPGGGLTKSCEACCRSQRSISVPLTGTCIITNSGSQRVNTFTTDFGPKSLKEFNSILCWAKNFVVTFFFF